MTETLRVKVASEEAARSLADELVGLVGLDVHPDEEEGWEVSVGCVRTDRLVVRVFEAARSTGACGTLLLDGREYDV
jgi:hypothetical protein